MSEVLERGDIRFFYRPRVGAGDVRTLDDVQRFYVVLRPDGSNRHRVLIVGRKRLPEPDTHEREWAFVTEVTDRFETDARPAGAGRYALVDHGGHTHLAYVLAEPSDRSELERALKIEPEASFVIAVRNPEASAPPGAGLPEHRRAQYPPELQERFGGRRFVPVNPPDFLDHAGAELVMIGAAADAERELGIDLDAAAGPFDPHELLQVTR